MKHNSSDRINNTAAVAAAAAAATVTVKNKTVNDDSQIQNKDQKPEFHNTNNLHFTFHNTHLGIAESKTHVCIKTFDVCVFQIHNYLSFHTIDKSILSKK